MKKFIILVTALLFFPALIFVGCGEKQSQKYQIVNAEYYIYKVSQFEQENNLYENGVDCVFVGDSWTDGWGDLTTYFPGISVLNRGIGGDNSFGLLQRLETSIYKVKPKVVVLLIGGNNMNDCDEDIKKIILNIKENCPETKIIMQSMYGFSNPDLKDKIPRMLEMNNYFKDLSNKYSLTYVNLYSSLVDNNGKGIEKYHIEDGVHMSKLGYQKIAEILQPVIYNLLEK